MVEINRLTISATTHWRFVDRTAGDGSAAQLESEQDERARLALRKSWSRSDSSTGGGHAHRTRP